MIGDNVVPLSEHFERLQQTGTPNYLARELDRHAAGRPLHLGEQDALLSDFLNFLAEHLQQGLRSPLVRSAERQTEVERLARKWLEEKERRHPELELAATPQYIRQLSQLAGLGPLEPLMGDPDVTEIIVENHRSILVEKNGRTIPVPDLAFTSEEAWRRQAIAFCALSGRPLAVDQPMQSFFLSDGSRVTAIIPPVAHRGTIMNIRRKRRASFTLEAMVERGGISADLARYLEGVVKTWGNVLFCGESGCGKTTMMEAAANCISHLDRAVVIEENPELNLAHPHLRYLLASADPGAKGSTLQDCTRFSMLIAPRRVIVGEAKEGEAADLIFLITSGFSGCMTTIHSYAGAAALDRLYIAAMMDPNKRFGEGGDTLRQAIASSVDTVVHVAFSPQGRRHVDQVHEVWGLDEDGRWDVRCAWEASYEGEEEETITWRQPEGYTASPRLIQRREAYRGRMAMEKRDLPETPTQRTARIERTYVEAVALGSAGMYPQAVERLQSIRAEEPDYRDTDRLIADFDGRLHDLEERRAGRVESLRERALTAAERGDRDTALWAVEEVAAIEGVDREAVEQLRSEVLSQLEALSKREPEEAR